MIYEDEFVFIEREISPNPWLKIFTKIPYKELSDCDEKSLKRLFEIAMICEKAMIEFYHPTKINIASFANYIPKVHIHITARFEWDEYFPECMWGVKKRKLDTDKFANLPEFDEFVKLLKANLTV